MEQPYWAGIEDSLADGIQFVENHARLTESTEGSTQRPAKKKGRFSRVLDMQIRIPVSQPPPAGPSPLAPPAGPSRLAPPAGQCPPPPPPPTEQCLLPPPTVVDDSQFNGVEFEMSRPSHPTPAAPISHPSPQAISPIQVILTTST